MRRTLTRGILYCSIAVLAIAAPNTIYAQDLGNISKKDILKVSGGASVQTTTYTAFGIPAKRDPFLAQLNLNLNLNILGVISAPFSATLSTQNSKVSTPQPFNNFGISPKYKAVTAHIGYRSINLSEFSLSGSQFLGVGVEIDPKGSFVRGKALYGRFAQPVFFNRDGTLANTPSFSRTGWGTGISLGRTKKNEVSFHAFRAKDNASSLDVPREELTIRPSENFVFGVVTKQAIGKKITLEGEFDVSAFTNDTEIEEEVVEGNSYINNIFLFNYNPTSELKKAMSGSINYKLKVAKISLKYRRVDPEYRTLGTSFINNDYEDLSLKTSFGLLKKKLNVSLTGGGQRNNLAADKVSQLTRLIGAVNASYKISEKWNTSVNFSNFTSSTKQTVVVDFDSLRFVQTTKSIGGTISRSANGERFSNSLSLGINYQDAIVNSEQLSNFYNGNIGWQGQFPKAKFGFGTGIMAVQATTDQLVNTTIGPSLNINKALFKDKFTLTFMGAYLNTFTNDVSNGEIISLSANGSISLTKKIKMGISAANIIREVDTQSSSELTGNFNLNYSF